MGEARLGVTDMIDKIARLPGLQRTFDKVAFIKEEHVLNARRELHEMAHSHGPDGIKTRALTPQAFFWGGVRGGCLFRAAARRTPRANARS